MADKLLWQEFVGPGQLNHNIECKLESAESIAPYRKIALISGSTPISTIELPWIDFAGDIILVPLDGTISLLDTGNIAVAVSILQHKAMHVTYVPAIGKWCPSVGVR